MLVRIDLHSGVPAYRQLVDQIRLQVAAGRLKPGDEIPSTRALSAELSLNPMTISRAYALLEEEGVLERRPGLPLVVRARSSAAGGAGGGAPGHKQFTKAIRPVASVARQLGISGRDAGEMLRRMIDEDER
jgi:GntR family transcriptional regulator